MIWMLAAVALQAAQSVSASRQQAALDKVANERTKAFNKATAVQTAKSFNEIAIQKSVLAAQTANALVATDIQGQQVKSARGLQAAGTDTMGASVEQNLLDVDQKVADAKYQIGYNEQISALSLDAATDQVADTGSFSLRAEKPLLNTWGAALGNAAASGAMVLFENKAKTGTFTGKTVSRNQGID